LVFLGAESEEDALPPVIADFNLGSGAQGEEEASASAAPSSSIKSSSSGSKSTASASVFAIIIEWFISQEIVTGGSLCFHYNYVNFFFLCWC
jgi:hypothetical protein